jgi:hypothetical protein
MAAANEGKILVVADVAELAHKPAPARSPAGDHPITATLKGRIEALEAEQAKMHHQSVTAVLDGQQRLTALNNSQIHGGQTQTLSPFVPCAS